MRPQFGANYFTDDVSVKDGVILRNNRPLVTDAIESHDGDRRVSIVTPNELIFVLGVGKEAIHSGLRGQYDQPSLLAVRLGFDDDVLTETGRGNDDPIHSDPREIYPNFHPYWFALLEHTDYIPEVRSRIGNIALQASWLTIHLSE